MNICCNVCDKRLHTFDLPPVCAGCSIGAKQVLSFPFDSNKADEHSFEKFNKVIDLFKEKIENEKKLNAKVEFLSGFVSAFREQNHTDILIKPGNNGLSIPAHKALLAARSGIFKIILRSDVCKATLPEVDTITIEELNYEELKLFLEFLYSGNLSEEHAENHIYALSKVADKYEIPFLQKICERTMVESLNSSNVLDILKIADKCTCYNRKLKKAAVNYIVKNMEDVVFTNKFDAFAINNPHLTLEVTRAAASLKDKKSTLHK